MSRCIRFSLSVYLVSGPLWYALEGQKEGDISIRRL